MKHNNKNMVFKAFLLTVPKFWFWFWFSVHFKKWYAFMHKIID